MGRLFTTLLAVIIRPLHRRIVAEVERVAASEAAFAAQLELQRTHAQVLRALETRVVVLERQQSSYAVVALDLDHFERLNDTHGHATGDQALRLFSRVLCATAREGDSIARLGGEEFVILMPDQERTAAAAMAEEIRRELLAALVGGALPPFAASAGVADSSQAQTFDEVLALADAALYSAKSCGRDRVAIAA